MAAVKVCVVTWLVWGVVVALLGVFWGGSGAVSGWLESWGGSYQILPWGLGWGEATGNPRDPPPHTPGPLQTHQQPFTYYLRAAGGSGGV